MFTAGSSAITDCSGAAKSDSLNALADPALDMTATGSIGASSGAACSTAICPTSAVICSTAAGSAAKSPKSSNPPSACPESSAPAFVPKSCDALSELTL